MASTPGNETSNLAALAVAEDGLRQISKNDFNELSSYAKPPLALLAIFEGVGILLDPSKQEWNWADDKKLIGGGLPNFLQHLFNINKDQITNEQLQRLDSILERDDCQPAKLARISLLCQRLGAWLRAIVAYAKEREQYD